VIRSQQDDSLPALFCGSPGNACYPFSELALIERRSPAEPVNLDQLSWSASGLGPPNLSWESLETRAIAAPEGGIRDSFWQTLRGQSGALESANDDEVGATMLIQGQLQ
jgi:hypothetical protein